jgi:hypothetical protein
MYITFAHVSHVANVLFFHATIYDHIKCENDNCDHVGIWNEGFLAGLMACSLWCVCSWNRWLGGTE